MKIVFHNTFHETSTEVVHSTSNREVIVFTGRKVRRILDELCGTDGCDCIREISITIDEKPAQVRRFDPDVEDDETGLEIAIPG